MSPNSLAPRRRLPAAVAKERILAAAGKRLQEGGPDAIRLKDLAGDLGISHPTILHHFGSREGLMQALEAHAMTRLQADLLAPGRSGDSLELVHSTLGDQGHARLLAWMALSNPDLAEQGSEERMLEAMADALHQERIEAGVAEPDPEDSIFAVRLVAAAMIGEALLGPLFTRSAGLGGDPEVSRRFRAWFARLVDGPEAGGPG